MAADVADPVEPVTFLLSDVEGSTRRWEAAPEAMAVPRHYDCSTRRSRVTAESGRWSRATVTVWSGHSVGRRTCPPWGLPSREAMSAGGVMASRANAGPMEEAGVKTRLFAVLASVALTVGMWSSASAITWGRPDVNNEYPNVASVRGIVEAQNLARISCSGSLLQTDATRS